MEGNQGRNSVRTGTRRQELRQSPWRNTAYRLASLIMCCSAYFVTVRPICPGLAPPRVHWAFSH